MEERACVLSAWSIVSRTWCEWTWYSRSFIFRSCSKSLTLAAFSLWGEREGGRKGEREGERGKEGGRGRGGRRKGMRKGRREEREGERKGVRKGE